MIERCPTCRRRMVRSHPQNSRYWLLLHAMADKIKPAGTTFSAETWHRYCASRFLGCDEVILPNGKTLLLPKSTSALDVDEFNNYMTAVEVWANEKGVYLEDAGSGSNL